MLPYGLDGEAVSVT